MIHTNKKHPFLPVGEITPVLHIVEANGQVGAISGWKVVPGVKTMYNLEVAQDHTFVVGMGQWVVHNCSQPSMIGQTTKSLFRMGGQEAGPNLGKALRSGEIGPSLWDRMISKFNGKTQGWWELAEGSTIPDGFQFVYTHSAYGAEHWEFRAIKGASEGELRDAANSINGWKPWRGKF